jgi:hypothetical protein
VARDNRAFLVLTTFDWFSQLPDPYQLTPSVTFLYLAVDQARRYLPSTCLPPSMPHLEPLSKMS